MSPSPTVFVVDDESQVRRALGLMLEAAGYKVCALSSAVEFLEQYDAAQPGCLLLDVQMPEMDGLELQRRLKDEGSSIPIIFLSAHGDIPMAVQAVQDGAVDFLEKPADPHVLRQKVIAALDYDRSFRRQQGEREEIRANLEKLTPREREVLEYLVQGKPVRIIAQALGSKESTVRVQRHKIYGKMRADSPTDLLRMMTLLDGDSPSTAPESPRS